MPPIINSVTRFKLKYIKELHEKEFTCIKKITSPYTILLQPSHLQNIKTGIQSELENLVKTYCPELNGILLAYEDVKIVSPSGWLFDTSPFLHVNITAQFYIFAPEIGSILKGKVVKKSPNHVGCLVHGIFNASSSIPYGVSKDQWCGSRVSEGDEIDMKITELNLTCIVPYLRGELIPESIRFASLTSTGNYQNTRKVFDDADSGISSNELSVEEDSRKRRKRD